KKEVESGKFREDLFYRLSVIPIDIPPLKERKQDILPIAYHFLSFFGKQTGSRAKMFSPEAEQCLLNYDWPGNIRELKNVIERILVLRGNKDIINVEDLPEEFRAVQSINSADISFEERVREFEKGLILDALKKFSWNKSKAAEYLKMSRRVLNYKVGKYGIRETQKKNFGH
ncbi:MAG: helix-turn-helix domain-containing protein, partial [Candidatus Ratteibacteria bacterium]